MNTRLERDTADAVYTIETLLGEIKDLEKDNESLQKEIDNLNDQIDKLEDQ